MAEAYGRGVVWWEFDASAGSPPPPPPPPPPGPPAARLDFTLPARSHGSAYVYDGFGGATAPPPPPPGSATITIRLLDAAVSGAALPDLTAIQWAWWDDAADESETWGVMPTAMGTTQTTNAGAAIALVAASSSKTSGQTAFIKLYKHGYPPRAFSGLLTVD
jgi:hypothetical protein